eukprot:2174954-Alexandrium_andersonii.AAC.1
MDPVPRVLLKEDEKDNPWEALLPRLPLPGHHKLLESLNPSPRARRPASTQSGLTDPKIEWGRCRTWQHGRGDEAHACPGRSGTGEH